MRWYSVAPTSWMDRGIDGQESLTTYIKQTMVYGVCVKTHRSTEDSGNWSLYRLELNSMALALPEDGIIVACDINDEYTSEARKYWHAVGTGSKIDLKFGPAMDMFHELSSHDNREPFDFVFIDADKGNYSNY